MKLYFALDPLLYPVFISLTPESEFSLLCERMPINLTASWLTYKVVTARTLEVFVQCNVILKLYRESRIEPL